MKFARVSVLLLAFLAWVWTGSQAIAQGASKTIKVLIVTGGHAFEKPQFFEMFKANPDITFKAVEHPDAHALLGAGAAKDWDVLLLYDLYQPISDQAKADFVARLKEGKGLVVLHHAIANYQDWPEYAKIIGARYYLQETEVDGVKKARSAYQHDLDLPVKIKDAQHPITAGLKDFVLHDETYKLFDISPDAHVLLTADHPASSPVVGWTKTYEQARVVYLQGGHDHLAYENPNFRQLVRQAINWAAPGN